MSALDTFNAEVQALHGIAQDLGKTLLVADLSVRAGFAGAPEFRRRIGAFLGEGTTGTVRGPETGCGCPAQNPPHQGSLALHPARFVQVAAYRRRYPSAANPPLGATLRTLGTGALKIAREAAAGALKAIRRSPVLTIAVIGSLAVWDVLVPDEAVEVARFAEERKLYSEQFNRLSPQEALRILNEQSDLYSGGSSGTSPITWLIVGLVGLLVGVPLIQKALK